MTFAQMTQNAFIEVVKNANGFTPSPKQNEDGAQLVVNQLLKMENAEDFIRATFNMLMPLHRTVIRMYKDQV